MDSEFNKEHLLKPFISPFHSEEEGKITIPFFGFILGYVKIY